MARAPSKPKAAKRPAPKKTVKAKLADMVVNQTEMAGLLGVSTRWLRELVKDGVVETDDQGKFSVGTTIKAYATFLKEGVETRSGSSSMDELRSERALEIRMNRMRKERDLIALDEALGVVDELTGIFVSMLNSLPAEITSVPRERARLNDIIDGARLRLTDRFGKKIEALRSGEEDPDTEAED